MSRIPDRRAVLVTGASLALLSPAGHAAVLNVPAAFPTIQAAVNAAVDGDEVVVANGIYNTDVDILGKSITLRSASNLPAFCVINCTAATGVTVLGAGETCVIRGFLIRNGLRGVEVNAGAGASIENCIIQNHSIGGMLLNGESVAVKDCTIRNNTTTNAGAGMLITDGDVTIRHCDIDNNAVTGFNAFGGGVHVGSNVTLTIVDSSFSGNTAIGANLGRGGALYASGGGTLPPMTIMATTFDDNEASERGGALYVEFRNLTLGAAEVTNNTALAGGGMFLENGGGAPNSHLISNSLIAGNQATNGSGGGIRNASDSTLTVTNATIMANTSSGAAGGGVANGPNSAASFTNCIVGGSSPDDFAGAGTTVVTYSNVEDGFAGVGNISTLPLFVDATAGNYRLAAGSPCIDAGNTLVFTGPAMDLDGSPRIVDDAATVNTGLALSSGTIDMGAYEVQAINTCTADTNGDGAVDADDLVAVILSWGACP
jgi:hypothetical protein